MNEQRNLYLAIVISIAIILFFQIYIPTQPNQSIPIEDNEKLEPATSIDGQAEKIVKEIQSREDIINATQRVFFENSSVQGSINLKGAIIDDLILLKYKTSLDADSDNIQLLLPDGTANPYYIETGWLENSKNKSVDLPDFETIWTSNGANLTPSKPVTLTWTNNQNIKFRINYTIDEDYMFNITQEVVNNSNLTIELYPYRLIKRINTPNTLDWFISHEGLISHINEELLEKKYSNLAEDCNSTLGAKKTYCDNKSEGGWLGFTDKYWMSVLIPDENQSINVDYRHSNNGRNNYKAGYAGQTFVLKPSSNLKYTGKLFVGAKKLNVLSSYDEKLSIPRFTDAIDWGWFSFLTKPVSYAINWFYGYAGNFGLAIIAFTILMRLILFPLAQASFKSMAKMKKLQPDMQRLKETYPNDRQKMQQELMALYKREGANPVAGCLPILVQIPIFFSLYKVLFVTIEMYHAPFYGWIHDLSAPDPLGLMTLFGLIDWEVPSKGLLSLLGAIDIGILPIFMGFTMWLQQKLNPAPADPTQARIFALLPFVFTFVLAGFAAGLVLYWSVNNILSIAQQWFIQRRILAKNG